MFDIIFSYISVTMRFPDDIYNIITTYKKLFERREKYDRMLACYASAITHKPEMRTLSQREARQAFVRLFPNFRDFIRYVAEDLEQYLGPPVNLGDDIKVWFMLQKDLRFPLFPPFEYLTEYYDYSEEQPERTV